LRIKINSAQPLNEKITLLLGSVIFFPGNPH
jgi:hypothetical protein